MTENQPRARLRQQPIPKAGPTTSTARTSALSVPSHKSPVTSRSSSRAPQGARALPQVDVTNDKATASLIRRVLCPQSIPHGLDQRGRGDPRPLEELLPPLTSSNEVDLQLYALIAIIMKEFVYNWYSKITPDHSFADEVIQIIAHCTRALEQRLRRVDVDALVLDEIPALVEAHIVAYRAAQHSPQVGGSNIHFRAVYHSLISHPVLSPVPDTSDPTTIQDQQSKETMYRQLLAQGVLAVLLPTEDLENVCLRTLVGDILADLILGEFVCGKASEGWFIWETVSKLVDLVKRDKQTRKEVDQTQKSRLERFGLLSTRGNHDIRDSSKSDQSALSSWLWGILQCCYLIYIVFQFMVVGIFRVASSNSSAPSQGWAVASTPSTPINPNPEAQPWSSGSVARPPVLRYRLFGMVSQLIDVSRRMPWLGGILALVQHAFLEGPGRFGERDGIFDRFLHQTIQEHLLTPTFLPILLLAVRTTLFPANAKPDPAREPQPPDPPPLQRAPPEPVVGNAPLISNASSDMPQQGLNASLMPSSPMEASIPVALQNQSGPQPPSPQLQTIKRACAASILSLIPRKVALTVFAIKSGGSDHSYATDASSYETGIAASKTLHDANLVTGNRSHSSYSSSVDGELARGHDNSLQNATPQLSKGIGADSKQTSSETAPLAEEAQLLSALGRDVLDVFADTYCNKHLIYAIIETILVKLIPELSEHGVRELMMERGI